MIISKFVIVFNREGHYFLYNTRTQHFVKIDNLSFQSISDVKTGKRSISELPDDLVRFLESIKCIDSDNNQATRDFYSKMEYRKRFASFGGRTLGLIIAPTLACNFACPYCYEANLPISKMTPEVEDNIIRFIKSYEKVCDKVEICWDGGEPLIGFENIKSLLNKIDNESSLKIKAHHIVTNGYLLTPEICNFFREKKLDYAQITIDGKPDTHNKSRILKTGGPTYDIIIKNIDMLTNLIPDCEVVLRTNIHNGNKDEYGELYTQLTARWKDKNVKISPTFVLDNDNCKVSCCNPQEKTAFFIDLHRKHNISKFITSPQIQTGKCTATAEYSFVIDPRGNLYKCWNDIGIEDLCVGNVVEGVKNNDIVARYVVGSDKFKDSTCLDCNLFPICDGGCNRQRIDNIENGTNYKLCPIDEEGLCDQLYELYKIKSHEI